MGLYICISSPVVAMPLNPSPIQSAVSQHRWGFHIVQRGVDPEEYRWRSRVVGAVDIRGIY